MVEFGTPQFWLAGLEIIIINILLSGDNAVVIALACRNLPKRQRRLGIFYGVIGAVVLRIILTFFAVKLLELPYLQLVGAALLLWIGIKLIAEEEGGEDEIAASDRLVSAVKTVIVADLVMSLDNVIGVAGAAKGSLALLVFGLVISIPLVVVGAQIIMLIIERFPILVIAGGGLLGWIAGEIAVSDAAVKEWILAQLPSLHWIAPTTGVIIVVAIGTWLARRRIKQQQAAAGSEGPPVRES
ncbi:MAG TPA: TerC family protein [Casimicrobiaceae bacterium]|nr:TerC family protein [Casimicrobiaceae bacterium]